jgi:hypothetical protein
MKGLLVLAIATSLLAACASDAEDSERFSERGVTFKTPRSWSVSGFSETVIPERLVAASYDVSRGDVEGDCGGREAIERLPRNGTYIVLIDYGPRGPTEGFTDRLPVNLRAGELAEWECFARSYQFRFLLQGRALQAHIGFGPDTPAELRAQALGVLNSVEVDTRPSE